MLREELGACEPSVVIAKSPCVLQFKIRRRAWSVDRDLGTGCKVCLRAGCTALSLANEDDGTRRVEIAADVCNGCGVCAQLCKLGTISGPEAGDRKDARMSRDLGAPEAAGFTRDIDFAPGDGVFDEAFSQGD